MERYRVDSSLCRLAAITISKELWKYSHLKATLKLCVDCDENPEDELSYCVNDIMSEFAVPEPVKEELTFVVGMMGQEIWHFYDILHQAYYGIFPVNREDSVFEPEPSTWVDYIRWTEHGCLDFSASMRSLYSSNILPVNFCTWMELCCFCLEDCINDFWPKVQPEQVNELGHRRMFQSRFEADMILGVYWITRIESLADLKPVMNLLMPHIPEECTLEEKMFLFSFVNRKDFAVKHFWGLLSDNQRTRTIATICERIMSDDPTTQHFRDIFFSAEALNTRSLIFFLNQLSFYGLEAVRIKILGSGFVLTELLDWPYYDSFMKTLKEAWTHHDSINYDPIISWLCKLICHCTQYQFIYRDVKYRRIFYEIWKTNPKNLKNSINYTRILMMMWKKKEVELMSYILKDAELSGRRKEFLAILAETYDQDETEDDFLGMFITDFLVSEEEREWFKSEINANSY